MAHAETDKTRRNKEVSCSSKNLENDHFLLIPLVAPILSIRSWYDDDDDDCDDNDVAAAAAVTAVGYVIYYPTVFSP